jgi:hypothetical protein
MLYAGQTIRDHAALVTARSTAKSAKAVSTRTAKAA